MLAARQENVGQSSVTLLWQQPDQPNGVILEYEIKYYEKVPAVVLAVNVCDVGEVYTHHILLVYVHGFLKIPKESWCDDAQIQSMCICVYWYGNL